MLTVLGCAAFYLIGAIATFRVWIYRFPPTFHKKDELRGPHADCLCRYKEDTWMIEGWDGDTGGKYPLISAQVFSFLLWWIIAPVVIVREIVLITWKGISATFMYGTSYIVPKQYQQPVALSGSVDMAEEYGKQEVEKFLESC